MQDREGLYDAYPEDESREKASQQDASIKASLKALWDGLEHDTSLTGQMIYACAPLIRARATARARTRTRNGNKASQLFEYYEATTYLLEIAVEQAGKCKNPAAFPGLLAHALNNAWTRQAIDENVVDGIDQGSVKDAMVALDRSYQAGDSSVYDAVRYQYEAVEGRKFNEKRVQTRVEKIEKTMLASFPERMEHFQFEDGTGDCQFKDEYGMWKQAEREREEREEKDTRLDAMDKIIGSLTEAETLVCDLIKNGDLTLNAKAQALQPLLGRLLDDRQMKRFEESTLAKMRRLIEGEMQ